MPDLPSDLAAIKARCEAATSGPWCFPNSMKWMRQIFRQADVDKVAHPQSGCPDHALATVHLQYCKDHSYPWEANAAFIAHAREDLPRLLARLEEMQTVLVKAAIPLEALAWSVIDELSVQSKEEIAQAVAAIHAILRDNGT